MIAASLGPDPTASAVTNADAFAPARDWRDPRATRLLVVDRRADGWSHARIGDLGAHLVAGDVLVVNDAATLPASLPAHAGDRALEVRLARLEASLAGARPSIGLDAGATTAPIANARALVFDAGDWRTPTESRTVPTLRVGARITFDGSDLAATVVAVDAVCERLVELAFERAGAPLWSAIYAVGRPIQYSYLARDLPLWASQNSYASRPWAVESPSAGRGLTLDLVRALRRGGVGVASLTHATGLSSTGDPIADATLPWPETSAIPAPTVALIAAAKAARRRVIAVGTSVVRALEGRVRSVGHLAPGVGITDVIIGPAARLAVVDGLLTGLHEPTASHFRLLQAFADPTLVRAAYADAATRGYLGHELGDANLII